METFQITERGKDDNINKTLFSVSRCEEERRDPEPRLKAEKANQTDCTLEYLEWNASCHH